MNWRQLSCSSAVSAVLARRKPFLLLCCSDNKMGSHDSCLMHAFASCFCHLIIRRGISSHLQQTHKTVRARVLFLSCWLLHSKNSISLEFFLPTLDLRTRLTELEFIFLSSWLQRRRSQIARLRCFLARSQLRARARTANGGIKPRSHRPLAAAVRRLFFLPCAATAAWERERGLFSRRLLTPSPSPRLITPTSGGGEENYDERKLSRNYCLDLYSLWLRLLQTGLPQIKCIILDSFDELYSTRLSKATARQEKVQQNQAFSVNPNWENFLACCCFLSRRLLSFKTLALRIGGGAKTSEWEIILLFPLFFLYFSGLIPRHRIM
jgi:hypothetical protein